MSIVATEIVHIDGTTRRQVYYRCQDSQGVWHSYGPVFAGPDFDAEAHKAVVAEKVASRLAESEFAQVIG